jgi:hypothetical protein
MLFKIIFYPFEYLKIEYTQISIILTIAQNSCNICMNLQRYKIFYVGLQFVAIFIQILVPIGYKLVPIDPLLIYIFSL